MSNSEDTLRPQPTNGLRVEVVEMAADREQGPIARIQTKLTQYAADARQSTRADWTQAGIDATHINWLIETDEKRREHIAKQSAGNQDLLIDMGDMSRVDLDGIRLDEAYESMTEDFIQTANNIIIQGIPPINALFSMSQAFAIVLGYALRANLNFEVAKALITQVMKSATASEKMVRIITKQ